jgi:hypothetical protein
MIATEWLQVLALATPMALTLMLALEMVLAMALMRTRAVVAQARLCRRRLHVAGAGVDAGADDGAYAGGNAGTDACADAGASTDAGSDGTGAHAGADTGDALMLALAQPLMPALALMLALMLAHTLVIMAGASTFECGDEPNVLHFDEARCAQARQKRVQWILIPTIKRSESLHLSCVQVRTSYRLYFLRLKKNSGQIRIRSGANNCIGILILAGELGFFGQIFERSNYLISQFLSPTYQVQV